MILNHPRDLAMLDGLHDVPWQTLEHAYGTAEDVPGLIEQLLSHDPKIREQTMWSLYGNVFHQGTRYPATPYVIPFLAELCASEDTFRRAELLDFWKSLICGYFNIQERPYWGDGETIYFGAEPQDHDGSDEYAQALHDIYRNSLAHQDLFYDLLTHPETGIRVGAVSVLACLPTRKHDHLPQLLSRLAVEESPWMRATIAFALGEFQQAEPLRPLLSENEHPAVRCMAACELARIAPEASLLPVLLECISAEIDGYDDLPGAGGSSTGDASFSLTYLPQELQQQAVPLICDQLEHARSFATMPLVSALLSAAFTMQTEPVTAVNPLQRHVLLRMLNTQELWSIGNLYFEFQSYGLPHDREEVAKLLGVQVANDKALAELSTAMTFAQMNFLEKARQGIEAALAEDPAVFARIPKPEECWLLCAKAFAETDKTRARQALANAVAIDPHIPRKIGATWKLAELLDEE